MSLLFLSPFVGKTTQIPQLVFDAAVDTGTGSHINLVVTQPRRISAISVAERIAQERVETVGQTAGQIPEYNLHIIDYFYLIFYVFFALKKFDCILLFNTVFDFFSVPLNLTFFCSFFFLILFLFSSFVHFYSLSFRLRNYLCTTF